MQGIRLLAHPTPKQKLILNQWMGCARFIWNAKCEENRYMTCFARKYYPIGTHAPLDQQYSHFKDKELTPWLFKCPSQILRNSTVNWYQTYYKFTKGECGKPRRKSKSQISSIHLTRELFKFVVGEDGNIRLFIGTKNNNIGYLSIKRHRKFALPNSIMIKRERDKYFVAFCYGAEDAKNVDYNKENLKYLQQADYNWLLEHTVGVDRGIVVPAQTQAEGYDFTPEQKLKKIKREQYIKKLQRKLARQKKGSNRSKGTKHRISVQHSKIANIRNDFCHKTSHQIVTAPKNKIIVVENLSTKNMSRSSKGTIEAPGKQVKAKSGLNKSILDKSWHKLETYLSYKSQKHGKAFFKVDAKYTSQACANCGHTHPDNRQTQSNFVCQKCGYTDNADRNAAINISLRAIRLIQDSGTELSKKGVLLRRVLDIGRGATNKTLPAKAGNAHSNDLSKKKTKLKTSVFN